MGAFFEKADQTIDAHNLAIKGRKLAQANERRVYRTHSSKDEREQRNIGNPNSGWGDSGRTTDQIKEAASCAATCNPDEFATIFNAQFLTIAPVLQDTAFKEEREWRIISLGFSVHTGEVDLIGRGVANGP